MTILDVTERLMVDEGYAAVTTRRVASIVELTPALVHYYFPTTDDLLLAVYRRAAERNRARLSQALDSSQPLQALWHVSIDSMPTVLAAEFMALANHRKSIGSEIAENVAYSRNLHAQAFEKSDAIEDVSADGLAFIMAAITRALAMERAIGISAGHDAAISFIETWLAKQEGGEVATPSKRKSPRRRSAKAARD